MSKLDCFLSGAILICAVIAWRDPDFGPKRVLRCLAFGFAVSCLLGFLGII